MGGRPFPSHPIPIPIPRSAGLRHRPGTAWAKQTAGTDRDFSHAEKGGAAGGNGIKKKKK